VKSDPFVQAIFGVCTSGASNDSMFTQKSWCHVDSRDTWKNI